MSAATPALPTSTVIQLSSNNAEGTEGLATGAVSQRANDASPTADADTTFVPFRSAAIPHLPHDGEAGHAARGSRGGEQGSTRAKTVVTVFGTCLLLFLTVFIIYNIAVTPLVATVKHQPLLGALLFVLYIPLAALTLSCWLAAFLTPAGTLKPYMAAAKVEAYVKEAVRDVCVRELGEDFEDEALAVRMAEGPAASGASMTSATAPKGATDTRPPAAGGAVGLVDHYEEERVKVNELEAARAARQLKTTASADRGRAAESKPRADESESDGAEGDSKEEEDDSEGEAAADTDNPVAVALREKRRREKAERKAARRARELLEGGDDADPDASPALDVAKEKRAMAKRRRVRERHGFEVFSLGRAALEAYQRLSGEQNVSERAEVVTFLLSHANLCHHCGVYEVETIGHCKHCNQCSVGQDQHCFMLGTCIGRDNHKYMVLFEFYCVLFAAMCITVSIYAVAKGYTFFFKVPEANVGFYMSFCFAIAHALVLIIVLVEHLYTVVGRGDTTTIAMQRERLRMLSFARRNEGDGVYQLMSTEEAPPEPGKFRWDNLKIIFGEDPRLWTWFVPTMVPLRPREAEAERLFRAAVGEKAVKTLRAIAHSTREDEEEEASGSRPTADTWHTRSRRQRRHQEVDVELAMEALEAGAADGNSANDTAAAELVARFTSPAYAGEGRANGDSAVGGGPHGGAAAAASRAIPAGMLSTADNPATPQLRPTVQRIPFFAKRTAAATNNGEATGTLHFAGPTFRTIDPLDLYNQPAHATAPGSNAGTAAAAAAAATTTLASPPPAALAHAAAGGGVSGPPAAANQPVSHASAAPPLPPSSLPSPAAAASTSAPKKALHHRAKVE